MNRRLDHFSWIAGYYDRLFRPTGVKPLQRLLCLPTQGRLLDVGGGTGRVSQVFQSLVSQLIVLDESAAMLKQARGKGLDVIQAQAEHIPFPDNSVERILVVDALHHVADARQVLAELCRLLRQPDPETGKPGGILVIEEMDIERWPIKLVALAEKLLLMRSHFLTTAQMLEMLNPCNVRVRMEREGPVLRFAVERLGDGKGQQAVPHVALPNPHK